MKQRLPRRKGGPSASLPLLFVVTCCWLRLGPQQQELHSNANESDGETLDYAVTVLNTRDEHALVGGPVQVVRASAVVVHREQLKKEKAHFLNFVRIPKTGSNSMIEFLDHQSGLMDLDAMLAEFLEKERTRGLACIYGRLPDAALKYPTDETKKKREHDCTHSSFDENRRMWEKAVTPWMRERIARDKKMTSGGVAMELSMSSMTIVREPFDRLRSYFYYVHKQHFGERPGWWKRYHTKNQYDCIEGGNFEKWLDLAHSEGMPHGMQHQYFSRNVTKAIEMIRGDAPQVTVLVNECFEASLRMLADTMSLPTERVDKFLDSTEFVSNETPKDEGRRSIEQETDKMRELRIKTMKYFPAEYMFYRAAVAQFKQQLSKSHFKGLRQRCDLSEFISY